MGKYDYSLCWLCKRSDPAQNVLLCTWLMNREPVDGWDAVELNIGFFAIRDPSYMVISCPMFDHTEEFYDLDVPIKEQRRKANGKTS